MGGVLYARALAEAHLGLTTEAHEHATRGLELSRGIHDIIFTAANHYVLAFLALSRGDPADAIRQAEPLPELLGSFGATDPGVYPFRPDAVEALVMVGRTVEARLVAHELSRVAQELDHPWGQAVTARAEADLASAEGNHEAAVRLADRAIELIRALPMPFELGRTLLVAGHVRRRARQKRLSRQALEEAIALFGSLGAPLWLAKARDELARVSGRAPSPAALTSTEAQVARLVAAGRSNKEVADALFISVNTVEANLTRIYRKLGLRSRAELAARASSGSLLGQT